jgi:hypothetical protein
MKSAMDPKTRDIRHTAATAGERTDPRQGGTGLSAVRPVRASATGHYDPVDLRLMDTFPASDAVARY